MKAHRVLALLFGMSALFLFDVPHGFAQRASGVARNNFSSGFAKTVGGDVAHVLTSPFRLSPRGGLRLLAFAAITAGAITLGDEHFDEEYAKEGHNIFYPFHELSELGKVYDDISPVNFSLGLSAATLAGGFVFQDKKLLITTRLMVESAILTQLGTALAKGVLGRARPYTNRGATDFNLFKFSRGEEFKSMPSGHVSSIFATMTVLAKQYDHWWVDVPAYTFAASVAFQRMESRNHWFSDTFTGAALGYWVGSTLVQHQNKSGTRSSFNPYFGGNRIGLVLRF